MIVCCFKIIYDCIMEILYKSIKKIVKIILNFCFLKIIIVLVFVDRVRGSINDDWFGSFFWMYIFSDREIML